MNTVICVNKKNQKLYFQLTNTKTNAVNCKLKFNLQNDLTKSREVLSLETCARAQIVRLVTLFEHITFATLQNKSSAPKRLLRGGNTSPPPPNLFHRIISNFLI